VVSGGSGLSAAQPARMRSGTRDQAALRRDLVILFPFLTIIVPSEEACQRD